GVGQAQGEPLAVAGAESVLVPLGPSRLVEQGVRALLVVGVRLMVGLVVERGAGRERVARVGEHPGVGGGDESGPASGGRQGAAGACARARRTRRSASAGWVVLRSRAKGTQECTKSCVSILSSACAVGTDSGGRLNIACTFPEASAA